MLKKATQTANDKKITEISRGGFTKVTYKFVGKNITVDLDIFQLLEGRINVLTLKKAI